MNSKEKCIFTLFAMRAESSSQSRSIEVCYDLGYGVARKICFIAELLILNVIWSAETPSLSRGF